MATLSDERIEPALHALLAGDPALTGDDELATRESLTRASFWAVLPA